MSGSTNEISSDPLPAAAGDHVSEPQINKEEEEEEELRYLQAVSSNVNVSNFVSVNLLNQSNYDLWKEQMLCLLDSQRMRGLVDDDDDDESLKIIRYYKRRLVKGWILRSLNEDMHRQVKKYNYGDPDDPRSLWRTIKRLYGPEVEDSKIGDVFKMRTQYLVFPDEEDATTDTEIPSPDNSTFETRDNDRKRRVALFRKQVTETSRATLNNSIYNKKLVKAVVEGRWLKAKRIIKDNKDAAIESAVTDPGFTMVCIAVKECRNNFLKRLLDFIDVEDTIDEYGRTALNYAAMLNNKCAAQLLVKKCKRWLFWVDDNNRIPLESAYENQNLDTFLYLWEAVNDEQDKPWDINRTLRQIKKNIDFDFVKDAISEKQYDLASRLVNAFPNVAWQDDRLMMAMVTTFPSDISFVEALYPSLKNFHQRIVKRSSSLFNVPGFLYAWADDVSYTTTRSFKVNMWLLHGTVFILLVLHPLYQMICLLIQVILYLLFMLYFLLWKILAITAMPIKRIEKNRMKYQEAKEFVNTICNHIDTVGIVEYEHPYIELEPYFKPFLEAICQGAYGVVDVILSRKAISTKFKDFAGNNILHLAGRLAPAHVLSRTTGAALQLQRELQRFQEVEKLMLPKDLMEKNIYMETPKMVFSREHADLAKEGESWMKTTSEACSITAALIVTIVFAAAITVPGGNDQETGIPLFKKEIAFVIFAVCDAISLFSGASALLVFLSILTTRFAEMDFLINLPRRLIIGLCALFLSTTSMMAAFSTVLFLVFCKHKPWMLAPIGGLTCMPIAVIVFLQLPLLVDLIKSTYIPIFGKQKYISSGKFISNQSTWEYEE